MYRCCECGAVFAEPGFVYDFRGEFWGAPAYETTLACPRCGGEFDEVQACQMCGQYTEIARIKGGICAHCLELLEEIDLAAQSFFAEELLFRRGFEWQERG